MAGHPTRLHRSQRETAVHAMKLTQDAETAQAPTDPREVTSAISPDYPEPLWVQAVNIITGEIEAGVLKTGTRLPPERELCQQLGISRVTLRKALTKLVGDGVLRPAHGRGWYVAQTSATKEWPNSLESFSETAERMGLAATSKVRRCEERPATLDEAELLLIAPGTPIFRLERVRLLGGMPIALDTTRIALSLVPDIATVDFAQASLYEELAKRGIVPSRADATIEAEEADAEVAALLDLDVGKPLLVMRQVALDQDEHPLFSSMIKYAGDRYRLRTSFARSSPA
jgi:DNA-binding GntR family transcriptional regulator